MGLLPYLMGIIHHFTLLVIQIKRISNCSFFPVAFLLTPVKNTKITVLFVWLLLKVSANQGVRTVTSLASSFCDCPHVVPKF